MTTELYAVRPPYERYDPLGQGRPEAYALEPGTLLALDLRRPPAWSDLALGTLELRRANPGTPVIARLPGTLAPGHAELARRVALLEVRAAVSDAESLERAVREALPRPFDLAERMARWLELRGFSDGVVRQLTLQLFRDETSTAALHDALTLSDPWLRSRLQSLGLPAPARWSALGRVLPQALLIQRRPDMKLVRIAAELGYMDQSAFTVALRQETGFTPAHVRKLLGWEWLVEGWLAKHATAVQETRGTA